MAKFMTRVELHDENDYEILHREMEAEGFSRIIEDDKTKKKYHLPPAEYYYKDYTTRSKDEVCKKAVRAVLKTNKKYSIVVTKSAGIKGVGLEEVKEEKN
ncbi:hypothetical protein CLU96_2470 [Chryseobacterium sp. 52]|uniref:DUF2622 domain-containing protein n=1 Tax=Chryseobacterium sp. 52 TaxID=2035213 RepID=UPI000C18DA7B|nr:DUF2622 domain-containing protein [Chryseobacterium sp. 52]PIF45465.1 hypothetical protein CLU96_2470 [Chryseobacterium sp. 52]